MKAKPICFTSNRVEDLYEELREALFYKGASPFSKRRVVIPSLAMKRWLSIKLARDEKAGAAFNIDFLYLGKTIPALLPGKLELALRIESEIKKMEDKSLHEYLKLERDNERIITLSQDIAQLFIEYSQSVPEIFNVLNGWQLELWKNLFGDLNPYQKLLKRADEEECQDVETHLFCLSFIPKLYLSYFAKLRSPVFIYALSPTAHFWSDIRTRSEALWISEYWKKKGVKEEEREELENILLDTNPLLADFGKVGRKFFSLLEENDFEEHSQYKMVSSLVPLYDDLLVDDLIFEERGKPTLLMALQTDLLLMRNPKEPLKVSDTSLQLHETSSKKREIEALYNTLLKIMSEKGVLEEDVLIMAPSIKEYAPFIELVFGGCDSLLEYQILDLKVSSQNTVAQGFELFLGLIGSRWSINDLAVLFEHPAFSKKHRFEPCDHEVFRKWIKGLNISWGLDHEHRQIILRKVYGEKISFELPKTGSWKLGMQELLSSLVMQDDRKIDIDFSESELLGRWLEVMSELMIDLQTLESKELHTLQEWSSLLLRLCDKYLEGEKKEKEAVDVIILTFSRMSLDERFSFDTILYHIKKKLCEESAISFDNKVSAVRFCSLLPMRAIPAKIVALVGLDGSSFPRKSEKHPLDLRGAGSVVDYIPTSSDYDRYLFLEAILSARDTLILSYSKASSEEETLPCDLIKELCNYVEIPTFKHPFDPFSPIYFEKDTPMPCYQPKYFQLARALINQSKKPSYCPFSTFAIKTKSAPEESVIDIAELTQLVSKPLKFYLNKVLNLYLHEEKEEDENEPLHIHPLHLYQLKKGIFKYPLEKVLDIAEKRGVYPNGVFQEIAKKRVKSELTLLQSNLKELGIAHVMTYHLEENCKQSVEKKGVAILPKVSVEMPHGKISIVGKIEDVANLGLLTLRKNRFEDLVKELPKHLILQLIETKWQRSHLVICTDGIVKEPLNAHHLMQKLLSYYFISKKNPSPLVPKWIEGIMNKEVKLKHDPFDPYLSLVDKENFCLDSHWESVAKDLFSDVLEGWHGKKI